MQVVIGDILGLCGRCGCEDFDAPSGPLKAVTPLTCTRCGTRMTYGEVVKQIAQEAVNQARHSLRISRQAREVRRERRARLKASPRT